TNPREVPKAAGARGLTITGRDTVCVITPERDVVCHNLENELTARLPNSAGALELVGTALAACARKDNEWTCWNIWPPMADTSGTFELPFRFDAPLEELSIGGFRICAVRAEGRGIGCADVNTGATTLTDVDELPE